MEIPKIGTGIYKLVEEKLSPRTVRKKDSKATTDLNREGVVAEISLSSVSENREEKIEEIKYLIENGLYKIDSKSIAENIIDELING